MDSVEFISALQKGLTLIRGNDRSTWTFVLTLMDRIIESEVQEGRDANVKKLILFRQTFIDLMLEEGEEDLAARFKNKIEELINLLKNEGNATISNDESITEEKTIENEWIKTFVEDLKEEFSFLESRVELFLSGNKESLEEISHYIQNIKGHFEFLDQNKMTKKIEEVSSVLKDGISNEELLEFKELITSLINEFVHQHGSEEKIQTKHPKSHKASKSAIDFFGTELQDKIINEPSFFGDFIQETNDHVQTIEVQLLELEANPCNEEAMHILFRAAHTIKGLAGFLELFEIQKLSHSMEALMDLARTKQIEFQTHHVDLMLDSTDVLKTLVHCVENILSGKIIEIPSDYDDVLKQLDKEIKRCKENLIVDPKEKTGEILIKTNLAKKENVDAALQKQASGDKRKIGEILVRDHGESAREIGRVLNAQSKNNSSAATAANVEESVRVPVRKLDQLIDAIGEAVIAQSMIVADNVIKDLNSPATIEARDTLRHKVAKAELIMRQIQEYSMGLRMVSIKGVFQKMTRLVRDLSKKLNKEVALIVEGEGTELDKTVVERIADPLVHMIRNSLDHGIENQKERSESGKSNKATIFLRAYHKAGNVVIEIQDDGRGLNREKILAKAIEKGLLSATANPSDNEVWQQIFRPGFSTADKVTDVSGRGVGMDVVRKNIEELHGSVDINSEWGKGTLFTIKLPLTLAIIDGMVIETNEEKYIVPTLSIQATVKPEVNQLVTVHGKGEMLNIRGELISLVRLDEVLETKAKVYEKSINDSVVLIVLDSSGKKVGILVDEILGQQQVVVKNMNSMGQVVGVTGGAIMNDGKVALILDVGGIIRLAMEVI